MTIEEVIATWVGKLERDSDNAENPDSIMIIRREEIQVVVDHFNEE